MEVPKIEGITPEMLWTFLVVLVGLMALVVLGHKVIEILRAEHQRKADKQTLAGEDVTDRIADKVMDKLSPKLDERFTEINAKFDEVNEKLANDKETLHLHTTQLNAYEDRVGKLEGSNKALCHGVLALLSHEVNGNSVEKITKAHDAMKNYLIDGVYREEAWQ